MSTNAPFNDLQRRNLEAASRLAQLSLEHTQRILALQTRVAQSLLSDNIASSQAQIAAKDPQELFNLRAQQAQHATQTLMESAKEIAEMGNAARVEFSRLLTEQLAAGNQELTEAFQGFLHTIPGGNANLFSNVQNAVANATQAFEQAISATTAAMTGGGKK